MTRTDYNTLSDILAWVHNEIARGRLIDDEAIPAIADMIQEYVQKTYPDTPFPQMDVSIR